MNPETPKDIQFQSINSERSESIKNEFRSHLAEFKSIVGKSKKSKR